MKIKIVYDNRTLSDTLNPSWGFSCLIEGGEKTILFDTGSDSQNLFHNMKEMNIDPLVIDSVVLSHEHYDHIGGLKGLFKLKNGMEVYIPHSFSNDIRKKIPNDSQIIEVDTHKEICKNIFTSGELGLSVKEQAIIIKVVEGLVVITGCAHPGIVNVLEKIKTIFKEKIFLVMGGFHLLTYDESQIREIVNEFRKLEVEMAGPAHCSGELAIQIFKQNYKDKFVTLGVGEEINIQEDESC